MKKKIDKFDLITNIIFTLLFIVTLFFVCYLIVNQIYSNKESKPLFKIYTIVSPSMAPNLKVYDVIINKRVTKDNELKKDDIITFYSEVLKNDDLTITHRINDIVVENGITYYITKGDNNINPDEDKITIDNIEGKLLFKIPKIGLFQKFISSIKGWVTIILIPGIILVIFNIYKLIVVVKTQKDKE